MNIHIHMYISARYRIFKIFGHSYTVIHTFIHIHLLPYIHTCMYMCISIEKTLAQKERKILRGKRVGGGEGEGGACIHIQRH